MNARSRIRDETGMGLIEIMVTVLVLTVGLLVSLGVFSEMSRATYVAQRKAVLVSMAQREMERLRVLPYDQIGLSGPMPAGAPPRCRDPLTCEHEVLVSGGLVDPGAHAFTVQNVSGVIHRYVTWRPQACPALNAQVSEQLSNDWGQSQVEVRAALGDLCPGAENTKRITIVVSNKDTRKHFGGPVRLSTVVTDPDSSIVAAGNYEGLRVEAARIADTAAGSPPASAAPYDAMTSQTLNLTDTPCSSNTRSTPSSGHDSHDTSRDGSPGTAGAQTPACAAGSGPDLMTAQAITGAPNDPLHDFSREVTRRAVGGRALARDDRAGACNQDLIYTASDADRRKRSVHTWATAAPTSGWETPTSAGRGTLTLWTQTAEAMEAPGRLCLTVWRAGTGEILGTADYRLQAWPSTPTQLAVSFDLHHAIVPAGERLMVTLRTPSDSGADLLTLYDHAGYQSSLTVTTRKGSELHFPGAGG